MLCNRSRGGASVDGLFGKRCSFQQPGSPLSAGTPPSLIVGARADRALADRLDRSTPCSTAERTVLSGGAGLPPSSGRKRQWERRPAEVQ